MTKITVVDDDLDILHNTTTMLKDTGYEVTGISELEGVIEELMSNTPDILILDLVFPENYTAGFDIAREIRATTAIKDLPIILLTGVNQDYPLDFSEKDIDNNWVPVQAFVEKPANIEILKEKIEELLSN